MATLTQVGEVITEQLRARVDRLVSAVENDMQDFTEIARVADAVGEFADEIADFYTDVERRLLRGLEGGGDEGDGDVQGARTQERRSRRQQPQPVQSESATEDVTKEELLEQARELHVGGRSSMTKDALAQAVQAEESVTKDELLERARDAHVEGRSSMSKDELREALHGGGS